MKKFVVSKKVLFIGILSCGYISYFLYMYTLVNDFLYIIKMDLLLRFSMATLLLVIFHMFVSELFKDFKAVDNVDLYNQYYNSVAQSYNTVFKVTSEIIHNKLTKYELEYNLVLLKKQKEYLEKVNIPKEYENNHIDIINYINEILETLN